MSDRVSTENDDMERLAKLLCAHVRLTWADRPFACQCEPDVGDGTEPHHVHVARALIEAGVTFPPGITGQS